MNNSFNLYSKYYNLIYNNKDYNTEAKYISNCIKKYSPQTKLILEFGSGSGGHGLILQQMGYDVYGLERSESMVEKALASGFNCCLADITDFTLEKKFDCVLALFHVISYLNTNEQLINAFNNANKHLNENGIFIFDVWYSPAVYNQKVENRLKTAKDNDVEVWRFANPEWHYQDNVIDVNYKILVKDLQTKSMEEINEKHSMRHFSIPEMALLAELTGFKIEKVEEFLTGAEPSENTWGVNFILRKK